MAKGKSKSVLDIPVTFGGVSIGQETARIGVTFARENIELALADEVFCGHRLSGRVVLGNRNDAPGTRKVIDTDIEIDGAFDTKKLSVSTTMISTGLTFSLPDIDIAEFARFSKGTGRLIVNQVSELPANAPDEHDEDADEPSHVPGSLKFEGDPQMVLLSKIFKGQKKILKAFSDAGFETVQDMGEYTASGKKLSDLPNMGPGPAKLASDIMVNFYSDNKK